MVLDKANNPFTGMLLQDKDCRSYGRDATWMRRASMLRVWGRGVRSREVRLGKRWKRRGREEMVFPVILKENRRRLMMERNCFETVERGWRVRWWPPLISLKMCSHKSSGKYEEDGFGAAVVLGGTLDLDDGAAIVKE